MKSTSVQIFFVRGSFVVAGNGSCDLLLLLADGDDVVWWDHETR